MFSGQSQHDLLKFFQMGHDPLNVCVLNADRSKMVKATDLKYGMHILTSQGQCRHEPHIF